MSDAKKIEELQADLLMVQRAHHAKLGEAKTVMESNPLLGGPALALAAYTYASSLADILGDTLRLLAEQSLQTGD